MLIILLLFFLINIVYSNELVWESMDWPPGGHVIDFVQNENNPNELYLTTYRGVYKSDNKAESWSLINNSYEYTQLDMQNNQLFLCSRLGVFQYENNIFKQIFSVNKSRGCQEISIKDNLIYVSFNSNTKKEDNKFIVINLNNQKVIDISPNEKELSDLVLPPNNFDFAHFVKLSKFLVLDDKIFAYVMIEAGEHGNGGPTGKQTDLGGSGQYSNGILYVSHDLGESWTKVNLPVKKHLILSDIIKDEKKPGHLIISFMHKLHGTSQMVSFQDSLFESFDNGLTWLPISQINVESPNGISNLFLKDDLLTIAYIEIPLQEFNLTTKVINGVDPIMKGNENLFFAMNKLLPDTEDNNLVYGLSKYHQFLKSNDNMKTWEKKDNGIISPFMNHIELHPTDPNIIIAASNFGQIPYLTKNFGNTSEMISTHFKLLFIEDIKFNPHNPSEVLFAAESSEIHKSDNFGHNLTFMNPLFNAAKVNDIEHYKNDLFFSSILGYGLSTSTNIKFKDYYDFEHFYQLSGSPDYSYDFEFHPTNNSILFASNSPKFFENHSSIYKFTNDNNIDANWSLVFKEESTGITALEFDINNRIYAGITGNNSKIIYSDNLGKTWKNLNPFLTFSNIHKISVDHSNEKIIYAAPWGGGLFRSINSGQTWTQINSPIYSVGDIIIDKTNSNRILISDRTTPVIYETIDKGITWNKIINLDNKKYYRIMSMTLHKGELYFSVMNKIRGFFDVIFRGPISGTTFKSNGKIINQIKGDKKRTIISFESFNNDIYAVPHIKGMYKLKQGKFIDISKKLPDIGFNNLLITNDYIYAAGASDLDFKLKNRVKDDNIINEVYVSNNDGQNWYVTLKNNPFNSSVKKIKQHPKNSSVFYVATKTGIYLSTDKTKTWNSQNKNLNFLNIGDMVITNNYVYVGTLGGGVYSGKINNNFSITWNNSSGPRPKIHNIIIKTDPKDSDILYTSSYPGGVFKSINNGETWSEINFALPSFEVDYPLKQGYYSLEIDPNNSKILYLGIYKKGVFKSIDGGNTWQGLYGKFGQNKKIMKLGIREVRVDPNNSDHIYLISNSGIYFSKNQGKTWSELNKGFDSKDILTLEFIGEDILAGSNGYGVFKLNKKTKYWKNLGYPIGYEYWTHWDRRTYSTISLLYDQIDPNKIFFANFPSGLYVSTNGAKSWEDSSLGLGNDGPMSIAQDQNNSSILYAGTYNSIFKSVNYGKTWEHKSLGMPSEQWPFSIAIDKNNTNILYTATKNGQNKAHCNKNDFCGVVMKSINSSNSWEYIMNGLDNKSEFYNIIIHPKNENILFLSSNKGNYISYNSGELWKPLNTGLPTTNNQVRYNVANVLGITADNKYLVLSLMNHGLWKMDISNISY